MTPDTLVQSLLRGRVLAATAATGIVASSVTATITGSVNDATALLNAVLALVSAWAAIVSKLRELRGKE